MEQQPIGYMLKQITDKIKVSADASLKIKGLTLSQVRVLEYVSEKGGTVTQKSIEEYLDVAHPTVVGIVSRMEKNGYLVTYPDSADKRNKIVELTGKAAEMAQEVRGDIAAQEEKLLIGLTEEETEILRKLLRIISQNVE